MNPLLVTYSALGVAIGAEIIGTSLLTASQQFTKLWPTICMIVSYIIAFYFLTIALRVLPVGIVYAVWSGIGITGISLIGHFFFRQTLDMPAVLGIALIIAGVVILNLFSRTTGH